MVSEGVARLFRRKDGKYLVYLPVDLCQDSQFPFQNFEKSKHGTDSIRLKVSFSTKAKAILLTPNEQ